MVLRGGRIMATVSEPASSTAVPAAQTDGSSSIERPRSFIQRNHFWLRRLHSLTGIVPIAGFVLFHFYENGTIFYGAAAYDKMATEARGVRYLELLEIFLILLPLLYHALYGLFIAGYARNNTPS